MLGGVRPAPAATVVPPGVLDAVCSRHGLPRPAAVRTRWRGATSTVLLLAGGVAVKVPHDDADAVAACRTHARVATFARGLGVRAPEVLGVEDVDALPVPVVVSRAVPGACLAPGAADPAVWGAVGAQLARLHAVDRAAAPAGLRTFSQHAEVDPRAAAARLQAGGRLAGPLAARLARLLDDLAPYALPDDRPVLCHGDVHAENVVVHDGAYAGLLDFAGAGWLDAAWDFVGVPWAAVPRALEGYATGGGRTDGLPERIAWCRLQTVLYGLGAEVDPQASVVAALDAAAALLRGRDRP